MPTTARKDNSTPDRDAPADSGSGARWASSTEQHGSAGSAHRTDPTDSGAPVGPSGADGSPAIALSTLTTIGLGGPAPQLHTARTADEVAELVGAADTQAGRDASGRAALVIGGGSNLVIADAGVDVPVVRIAVRGLKIRCIPDSDHATVTIGAGEDWDGVVATLTEQGWTGVESLSGIPGSAGATPVQNVGAYGTEIADVLLDVQVYDRRSGVLGTVPAGALQMGYRSSVLRGTDAAVVTAIRLHLTREPRPIRYAELARTLGVAVGDPAPAADVREAVLALRRTKGMVLDPDDPDTRSAGSFFTNPVLSDDQLAVTESAISDRFGPGTPFPRYPAGDHRTKLSAAWLIEHAGFGKGYPRDSDADARIAISGKHTLALTNRGGGTTVELVALARTIRDEVWQTFGVILRPEPVLVGVSLDG